MKQQVKEILARKIKQIDCTEEESSIIKSYLKETVLMVGNGDVKLNSELAFWFPLEYGEYLDEENLW